MGYVGKIVVDNVGNLGGLCLFWDSSVDVLLMSFSVGHIDVSIRCANKNYWRLTGFYGHPEQSQRPNSWTLLRRLAIREEVGELVSGFDSRSVGEMIMIVSALWKRPGSGNRFLILNEGASVKNFNSTIITLIPKVQTASNMTEFRPISLCRVLYKIIAKVISNRLKGVLGYVISETQCAFIPGLMISDNTIMGFECLHRLKRRKGKNGFMTLKLDMSKAYDKVE
ncbi:hypothetical protein Dsin_004257 [Dipteronia sinensis]|uniref:Reverse transcriptase domain-containing protein n=1 Tax=Dipteronia sinensis TaxID=43782 RepID=A0AAE0B951_9ROSI|nr:hypothetical protein Dsin_004257 [Dipteronia sinensis]